MAAKKSAAKKSAAKKSAAKKAAKPAAPKKPKYDPTTNTVVLTELAKPVPPGMLAYVKGTQVVMVPRKPRGKSKRIGCHIRKPNEAGGRRRMNRAGGSRKMTKAEVSASFAEMLRNGPPMDDVWIRTTWNDYTDDLYKDGRVTSAVHNSSVPAKFLKRKSNRAGGRRKAHHALGRHKANRAGTWRSKKWELTTKTMLGNTMEFFNASTSDAAKRNANKRLSNFVMKHGFKLSPESPANVITMAKLTNNIRTYQLDSWDGRTWKWSERGY